MSLLFTISRRVARVRLPRRKVRSGQVAFLIRGAIPALSHSVLARYPLLFFLHFWFFANSRSRGNEQLGSYLERTNNKRGKRTLARKLSTVRCSKEYRARLGQCMASPHGRRIGQARPVDEGPVATSPNYTGWGKF